MPGSRERMEENRMENPIEKLKKTRWWKPGLRRFAAQHIATKKLECPELRDQFMQFTAEILNTPEHRRDELLKVDYTDQELEAARLGNAPGVRYRQYDMPTAEEQKIGTVTKPKKKRG